MDKKQKREILELTDTLKRVQAEFENYKKREEKDQKNFVDYANAKAIEKMLPFADSFENAIEKLENAEKFDKKEVMQGLRLIKKQFDDFLNKEGLEEVESLGKEFDPLVHEVIAKGCDAKTKDGIILEEFQKGYFLNGKLLRPAKVKINKLEKGEVNE